MVDKSSYITYVSTVIDSINLELFEQINKPIHENPEVGYEEYKAHELLTNYISNQNGWEVTKSAYGIETLFVAVFTNDLTSNTPVTSYNAEYDALPEIGHACGHNLIATSSVAAALATAKLMVEFKIPGTVKLFGTPAEEGGGGKVKLLDAGAYEGVDISMMVHPGAILPGSAWGHTTAKTSIKCEFFGKLAHLAGAPWAGINALDAQVIYYNCVSVLRQQLMPTDIIHGNIVAGGVSSNVIANYTCNEIGVRAQDRKRLEVLKEKVLNCIKAAALATGCTYKVTEEGQYYDLLSNDPMCDIYRKSFNHFSEIDGAPMLFNQEQEHEKGHIGASTDQGNVSYLLPTIHPMFEIYSPKGQNHNEHFTAAAGTKEAHDKCLKLAKCMVLTMLEVLQSGTLRQEIRSVWEKQVANGTPDKVITI